VSRATGTDSPVIAASSTCTDDEEASTRSAGTTSPASRRTASPGTRSTAASSRSTPSRQACARGAAIRESASTARWARTSCTTPIAGVEDHHRGDDDGVRPVAHGHHQHEGTAQQQDHRVSELVADAGQHAGHPLLGEPVRSVLGEAPFDLRGGQAACRRGLVDHGGRTGHERTGCRQGALSASTSSCAVANRPWPSWVRARAAASS
jgi:hypothetical protein